MYLIIFREFIFKFIPEFFLLSFVGSNNNNSFIIFLPYLMHKVRHNFHFPHIIGTGLRAFLLFHIGSIVFHVQKYKMMVKH